MTERLGLIRGKGFPLGEHANRYPAEQRTLLRLLRDQAAEWGDKPWLIFDGTSELTYAEAWSLTSRVGNAVSRTAGEGAHVALFLFNQIESMLFLVFGYFRFKYSSSSSITSDFFGR